MVVRFEDEDETLFGHVLEGVGWMRRLWVWYNLCMTA
jgi:hypothetical protein